MIKINDEPAIIVKDVRKTFKLPHEQASGIKQTIVNFTSREKGFESQKVLDGISFEIKQGEFFGIVGRNGSGKSTLLKLLAGIYAPDEGLIQVNGSLTPFIELGVGFNPELTGRENVYLNGALLGFSRQQMELMYDDIVDFAELSRFMDQKLKNYSSGMQVRLAFAIAIRSDSDILLIDEVLAVGDVAFQTKCFDYFLKLKREKKTVILVSHDRSSLERFCTSGILLEKGQLISAGKIDKVLDDYSNIVLGEMNSSIRTETKSSTDSDGAKLLSINLFDKKAKTAKLKYGSQATLVVEIEFTKPIENPIFGITLWKKNNDEAVYATNNLTDDAGESGKFKTGDTLKFEVSIPSLINDGEYTAEIGVANRSATVFLLRKKEAIKFQIFGSKNPHSLIATRSNMKVLKG
jgi:ABC-2 type transport system ATP-binding protein